MKKKESYNILELFIHFFLYVFLVILRPVAYLSSWFSLYYIFMRLKINGIRYLYLFSHIWPTIENKYTNEILLIILFIITGVIIYIIIPLISFGIFYSIYEWAHVSQKDEYNNYLYIYETMRGKPHKERLSGIDWVAEKERKKEERQKRKNDKKFEKMLGQHPGVIKGYYTSDIETQPSAKRASNEDIVSKAENQKLNQAIAFYGFENFNFTKEQLDKQYRKMVIKFHPDSNPSEEAAEKSLENGEYYELLKSFKNW